MRKIFDIVMKILMVFICIEFIVHDRALLAALSAAIIAANASFDLVDWAEGRDDIDGQGDR